MVIDRDNRTTPYTATFKILSGGFIGTMKHRYHQGVIYVTHDAGEAEQLRRSSSAMEVENEEPASASQEAQVAEAQAEIAPPTKASAREQMMDKAQMPWNGLKAMAKDRGIKTSRKSRAELVDAILEVTDE